jgi:hypothetical protein
LRASFPQFEAYFGPWNLVGVHEKKSEVKNLMQLSLQGQFWVSRETDSSKNIFG